MLIQRIDTDLFALDVPPAEATVLADLCRGLRLRLTTRREGDELRRLFPPAHPDDERREQAYREMIGDELLSSRLGDLDIVTATLRQDRLTRQELDAWVRAINSLRLVLGTSLGITEGSHADELDPDDPDHSDHVLYDDLSAIVALIVHLLVEP